MSSGTTTSSGTNLIPLIVGLSLGLAVVLLVVAYLVYRHHRRNKWKAFANEHIDKDDLPDPDPSYPVTHMYFRGIRGHPNLTHNDEAEAKKVFSEDEEEEKEKKKPLD